jgi:hypothetical protein
MLLQVFAACRLGLASVALTRQVDE